MTRHLTNIVTANSNVQRHLKAAVSEPFFLIRSNQYLSDCQLRRLSSVPKYTARVASFSFCYKLSSSSSKVNMATGYSGFKNERFEGDKRWTMVDEYTSENLHARDKPLLDKLNQATANSDKNGLMPISVSEHQGKFLMLQARMKGAKHILELGLLGGYSTIWLANASPDVKVTTVEVDENSARVATENLKNAGVLDRVEVIVGAGMDVMPRLVQEVKDGKRQPYDFYFIDADKMNNWPYVDWSCQMATPGAAIIVDNVVRQAKLVTHTDVEPNPGNRRMIEHIKTDDRLDATCIQWVGDKSYDGFLLALVK